MNIAYLVDQVVMQHLSLYGCVKNADPFVQHMLKHSEEPILRFRRDWMRQTALRQHLDSERRQKKRNDAFKNLPYAKGSTIRQMAVVDPHLAATSTHYNKSASWNDREFLDDVRREAPDIFPKREAA